MFACWHSIIGSQLFAEFELENRQRIDSFVLVSFGLVFIIYTIVYASWVIRMQKQIERKKLNKNKQI